MADGGSFSNPLADEKDAGGKDGGGGGGSGGSSKTPMIVGGALVFVLVVIGVAVAFSGGDEPAPAPAPPVVVTAPPPPPAPPAPTPCNGHACNHGECVAAGNTYTCACELIVPSIPTSRWIGDMCDTEPPCAVCGAVPYCGSSPNCDPLVPPEPVVAELSFNVDIDPAELGPQFEQGFSQDLGRALEVPANSIIVLSISGGSITVRFSIVPEANFNSTGSGGYSYDPKDKLADLQAMIQSPDSVLFTDPRSRVFANLGVPISDVVVDISSNLGSAVMCDLHYKRMQVCNGQLSWQGLCADRNCLYALEVAAAEAAACNFEGVPSEALLCGPVDDPSTAIASCPADSQALSALSSIFTAPLISSDSTEGISMDGDAYIIDGFGAHFDGVGDRVQLNFQEFEPTYLSGSDDAGFALSFWFTKEVCHAEDRWEVLYMHTSSESDPFDLFNSTGTTTGVTAAVGCASQRQQSTVGGDMVRFRLKDDAGVTAEFDWQIGCAGSGSFLTDTWIHLVLSVHPTSIRVYADGVEQDRFGYPRDWRGVGGATFENPAYPNPNKLSQPLGSISAAGPASVGNFQGELAAGGGFSAGFAGRIAWVQVFDTALSLDDASCLFGIPGLLESCGTGDAGESVLSEALTEASAGVQMQGDVTINDDFGMNFDGDSDWAEVTAPDYTSDGSFTITLWVSQSLCRIPGNTEALIYHGSADPTDPIASMIGLYAQCWQNTPRLLTQIITQNSGGAGPRAGFNVFGGPGVIRQGGYETASWTSFGLSVSPSSVMLYVDGMAVSKTTDNLYGFGDGGNWMTTAGDANNLLGTNQANPNPSQFAANLGDYTGLAEAPIYLGGLPTGEAFFFGDMQQLVIFTDSLNMHQHDCLYQNLEQTVSTCVAADSAQASSWNNNYYASFTDGALPDNTFVMGDAYQNGAFGLTFDGDEDYLMIKGSTRDFADDGTFAISFWFTKPVCNVPGRWEFLFSQLEDESRPVTFSRNSGVDMFIGCGGRYQVSSVGGDILRTVLVDSQRNRAIFDVQLDYFGGGIMTDTWVYVVMNVHRSNAPRQFGGGATAAAGGSCTGSSQPARPSGPDAPNRFGGRGPVQVDNGGVQVFVDGQELPNAAFGYPCDDTNPCDGRQPGASATGSFGGSGLAQMIAAGGDDPAAVMAMLIGGGPPARPPPSGDQPTFQGGNRGGNRPGGRGGAGNPGNQSGNVTAGSAGGRDRTAWARRPSNVAYPDPSNFSRPLAGFTSSNIYEDNRPYTVQLNKGGRRMDRGPQQPGGLAPGDHTFRAMAPRFRRSGWNGGYWEILTSEGSRIAGGEVDGLVEGSGGDFEFTVPDPVDTSSDGMSGCACREQCTNVYTRRGRTRTGDSWFCQVEDEATCAMDTFWGGRRDCLVTGLSVRIITRERAGEIAWMIDDGAMYEGPEKSSVYIGGRAGVAEDHYFVGSISNLAISPRPLEKHQVDCAYLGGQQSVGECGDPEGLVFSAPLFLSAGGTDATPPLTPNAIGAVGDDPVTLHGNTYLDRSQGAVVDGDRDYVTFMDEGYTSGRSFTVSFWFAKKSECATPGRWEFLYSEAANSEAPFWRSEESSLEVYLACSRDDRDGPSGDILRTYLQDSCGQRAVFDINIDEMRGGGPVTSQWVSYVLSVSRSSMRLYIDGAPTGPDEDGQTVTFPEWGWASDSAQNLAFPDPENLSGGINERRGRARLCGFDLSDAYATWRDSTVSLDGLSPDTEYTINYESGAVGGMFMINSTVVTAVDYVAPRAALSEDCVPYCESVDTSSRWAPWRCSTERWCVFAPATNVTDATCVSMNVTTTSCSASLVAGDSSSCAEMCQYQAAAEEVLEVAQVVGVYETLLTQELSGLSGSATFRTPPESTADAFNADGIFIIMHTPTARGDFEPSSRLAAELKWTIAGTDLYGPQRGTTYLAGRSDVADDHFYMGSMSGVAIQMTDVDDVGAYCAFQSGEKQLGVCDWDSDNVKLNMFGGPNLDSEPRWGVTLGGNAHLQDDYGVTLDGMEDYVKIESNNNDYAATGRFALAFWFTKPTCRIIGDYEILYSHYADPNGWTGCRHGPDGTCSSCNPGISVMIGCFSDGASDYTATSTVSGDALRVTMTDDACHTAVWDSPLTGPAGGGGYVTDAWVHFALSTWGRGAHVYVDGKSIDSSVCYPLQDARDSWRNCTSAMEADQPEEACASVTVGGDGVTPACTYSQGEDGFPMVEDQSSWTARRWAWANTRANVANPSPRHFQQPMGPMTLWEEPVPGRDMVRAVDLAPGGYIFRPNCRGCPYARTGWGDSYWSIKVNGTTIAGGPEDGKVPTRTGEEVCAEVLATQEACSANSCCSWDNVELTCGSRIGDGSCEVADDRIFIRVPDSAAGLPVEVVISVDRRMQNTWTIDWTIEAWRQGVVAAGPIRGEAYLGAQNEGSDGRPSNSGYSGSIAGLKTFSDALSPTAAECIYKEANTDVGVCSDIGGVIYEAEFTAGGQAQNDPERDLNGALAGTVSTVSECFEFCKTEYRYFGLQWGGSCQCGNSFGQHGPAPATAVTTDNRGNSVGIPPADGECNWACRGNRDDSCVAADLSTCAAVDVSGNDTAADSLACTGAGDCVYTAEDSSVEVTPAMCISTRNEYCTDPDSANPRRCSPRRGCSFTAGNETAGVEAACAPLVSQDYCGSLLGNITACNEADGCAFQERVTQAEACAVRQEVLDACAAVDVNADDLELSNSGDEDLDADRNACLAAGTGLSQPGVCTYTPEREEMCGGADRNSIYSIDESSDMTSMESNYIGCFVDASGTSNDAISMSGDAFMDQGGGAFSVGGTEAGFGLTFDGDGDFATLKRAEAYSADGTFSLAFWFTKSACNNPNQPYQMLYSHMNEAMSERRPHIFIMLGCSHNGADSSAGSGDIIRITMQDDWWRRYTFDAPMRDAAGGGYVTSMWVHFVLTVSNRGARVYVDGADVSDNLGFQEPSRWNDWAQTPRNLAYPNPTRFSQPPHGPLGYRSMAGAEHDISEHATLQEALDACSDICVGSGYRYMGLQWRTQCFCDNQYDSRGEAPPARCGINNESSTPVCATEEWSRQREAFENATGSAAPPPPFGGFGGGGFGAGGGFGGGGRRALQRGPGGFGGFPQPPRFEVCGMANAVYDSQMQTYLGCFLDGDQPLTEDEEIFKGMTMDRGYSSSGGGSDDAGEYFEPVVLSAGSGSGATRSRHYLHLMGTPTGWAGGNYIEVWQNVSGTLTRLTQGGFVPESCALSNGTVCDADIAPRSRQQSQSNCEAVDGCVYTNQTCGDGCLDSEDKWVGFDLIGDEDADLTVKIGIAAWGNSVSWEIANMDMPWRNVPGQDGFDRRVIEASGPRRGHPTLGGTGGSGWLAHEEYVGSIAEIGIYWRPLSAEDVSCLYMKTQNILSVCVPPENMAGGPFYTTMNPHDLSADAVDLDDRATVERCGEYCADYDYFGLEWGHRCHCDNDYGSFGEADEDECNRPCRGDDTQNCGGRSINAVYQIDRSEDAGWRTDWVNVATFGRMWTEWKSIEDVIGVDSTTMAFPCTTVAMGEDPDPGQRKVCECEDQGWCADEGDDCICHGPRGWGAGRVRYGVAPRADGMVACADETFGVRTRGVRAHCACAGPDGTVISTADEGTQFTCLVDGQPGMMRYGSDPYPYVGCYRDRFEDQDGITLFDNAYLDEDYGVTFDGEGDYAEVDMERNGRWLTDDGSFTISFWMTKTACTTPGWWETLVSYYKYPFLSTWDPRNTHINIQAGCASFAHSTLEGDLIRVDMLDDEGTRSMFDFSMDSSLLDGPDDRATDVWVHIALSVSPDETNMYVDGKSVCNRGRGGGRGRCNNIGVPDFSDTPWADRMAWTQDRNQNAALRGGGMAGFDLTYGVCPSCDDTTEFDRWGGCPSVKNWVETDNSTRSNSYLNGATDGCNAVICDEPPCTTGWVSVATFHREWTDWKTQADFTVAMGDVPAGSPAGSVAYPCNNEAMGGDPDFGQFKVCECQEGDSIRQCAQEREHCVCTGSVRYGVAPRTDGTATCSDRTFGVRTEGVQSICECQGAPQNNTVEGTLLTCLSADGSPGMMRYGNPPLSDACPVTCGTCPPDPPGPPCDIFNMSSPRVERRRANLFLGGAPQGAGRFFTGSMNGFGLFRYPITQQEASCLFRFGESDVHVCQKADEMDGLFHAMTFLPAEPDMSDRLPHGGWSCGRSLSQCQVAAVSESCTPRGHNASACLESSVVGGEMTFDRDCCAPAGQGSCQEGFAFGVSTDVCWRGDGSNPAYYTYCADPAQLDADPGTSIAFPNCTFTPGDANSCDATVCTYQPFVPQQAATFDAVGESCLSPPDADPPVDCGSFQANDAASCPRECVYTPASQSSAEICTAENMEATCANTYDDAPGRCVFTPDDSTTANVFEATCSDPMGTPAGKDFCIAYCNSQGFRYTGLGGADDCFCSNSYGSGGQAPSEECDVDHDGVIDCGTIARGRGSSPPCSARIAVYQTDTGEELGCFRDPTRMPVGLELQGDAYIDDSGRHSTWGVGAADDAASNDFGLHFDGDGDFARINGVDNGYAADGTFAISLWVTKPACASSGREQVIYNHQGGRNARIRLLYVCSNNPQHEHSTVQQYTRRGQQRFRNINFMRVYLRDNDGQEAVFDFPVDQDDGFITDTWAHVVVSVQHDEIRVYLDGRRQRQIGYPIQIPHVMSGQARRMRITWQDDPVMECAQMCTGYVYSGLQNDAFGSTCYCDNTIPEAAADASQCVACGAVPCADNRWLCNPATLSDDYVEGQELTAEQLTAMCDKDMHVMPGMGQWMEAGTLVRTMCPETCNECPADPLPDPSDNCNGVMSVSEIVARASGEVVSTFDMGCFQDTEDAGRGPNWQDPAVNTAYPRLSNVTLGRFDIDRGYGDGGNDEGDFYIPVQLSTFDGANGTQHTFHAHAERGDWSGGSWRVLSADKDVCEAVTENVETACALAGACELVPQTLESCTPKAHNASACMSSRGLNELSLDDDCCAVRWDASWGPLPERYRAEQASCAEGFVMFEDYVTECTDDQSDDPVERCRCWNAERRLAGTSQWRAVPTYCVPEGTDPMPTEFPDCSFTPGVPSSCNAACDYVAPTYTCGPTVLASGMPNEVDSYTAFTAAVTGGMSCTAHGRADNACDVAIDAADDAVNQAACEGAQATGVCTYTGADADTPASCTAAAVTECPAQLDEDSCNTVGVSRQFTSRGSPTAACVFTPADSAVIVHINVKRWGNYIRWALYDVATGDTEGSGPSSSPIELGGMQRMWGAYEGFMGNIADLYIFYRQPTDEQIDCMYREQQLSLGSCRPPDAMWGAAFWDDLTSDAPENLRMWGASIAPGVGIDFTANNQPLAMSGSYALMNGLHSEHFNQSILIPAMTIDLCVDRCAAQGFAFAGLERGHNCWCDDSYDMYGVHNASEAERAANSDGCNAPCGENSTSWSCGGRVCAGDNSTYCGGNYKLSVYDTASKAYLGCYDDHLVNAAAVVRMRESDQQYALRPSFALSFWFTHNQCDNTRATGNWEPLFSQGGERCSDLTACPPQSIAIFLACNTTTTLSGDRANVIRIFLTDDDNQLVELDVPIGTENSRDASGGRVVDAWVHLALSVDTDTVAAYIDGQAVSQYGFFTRANSEENLAYGHISRLWRSGGVVELERPLTSFNFTGWMQPHLGWNNGGWGPSYFNGFIANLGIFRRALDVNEVACLYKYGETHLGLPTLP